MIKRLIDHIILRRSPSNFILYYTVPHTGEITQYDNECFLITIFFLTSKSISISFPVSVSFFLIEENASADPLSLQEEMPVRRIFGFSAQVM